MERKVLDCDRILYTTILQNDTDWRKPLLRWWSNLIDFTSVTPIKSIQYNTIKFKIPKVPSQNIIIIIVTPRNFSHRNSSPGPLKIKNYRFIYAFFYFVSAWKWNHHWTRCSSSLLSIQRAILRLVFLFVC